MNNKPKHTKWKVERGRWKVLLLTAAILFSGGLAKAQVKVRGSIFGGGEKANIIGNDTIRIHGTIHDTIFGNVYGGGMEGQVSVNAVVEVSSGVVGTPGAPGAPVASGGRVFGGGEGSDTDASKGLVSGNTFVTVSGNAQVLRNVYGGGELASVGIGNLSNKNNGVATVIISGGKIGPLDGSGANANVYGGGRGHGGSDYELFANVDSTSVIVCDSARIYGSVYGGSSEGHVLGDAYVQVKKSLINTPTHDTIPYIGTTGLTGYDGNVYGGGEKPNYISTEYGEGLVQGNTKVDISDGLMCGNVYGGGSYGLTGTDVEGDTLTGANHGFVTINITGGTIGFAKDTLTVGHVFGAGKGLAVDPEYPVAVIGTSQLLGVVKNTQVNISGINTRIHGSVYGGGELSHTLKNSNVTVSGGVIGSELPREDDPTKTRYNGSVYGGGRGFVGTFDFAEMEKEPGIVYGNTYVTIESGQVMENVFGGGELGSVGEYRWSDWFMSEPVSGTGSTYVTITGGQIGPLDGTGMNGHVYGGGKGVENDPNDSYTFFADVIDSHVKIEIPANADITENRVWGSVFGGGADGHVFGDANVEIKSGTIGTDDTGVNNGNVFGGGRNSQAVNYIAGRVAGNTHIDMQGGTVKGSVYGGGRQGITGLDAEGDVDYNTYEFFFSSSMINDPDKGKTLVGISGGTVEHNVYGSGKGSSDTIKDSSGNILTLGEHLGRVKNSQVTISDDAFVKGSVYGGGEMASVGWLNDAGTAMVDGTGLAKVDITGGQVGVEQPGTAQIDIVGGNVFGGGLGMAGGHKVLPFANVDSTSVGISGSAYIISSVFGGGNDGHVLGSTNIHMKGGTVGQRNTLEELITDSLELCKTHIYTGSLLGGGRGTNLDASGQFNDTTGRVFGNTYVTVKAGTVRHAVYGGGGLSSVGTYTIPAHVPVFSYGGKTHITIDSCALIGPKKEDLIGPFGIVGLTATDSIKRVDSLFMYLGGNSGWVFGAGCGLAGGAYTHLTANDSSFVTINGNAQVAGSVYGGGENGHLMGSSVVNIKGGIIGGLPLHGTDEFTIDTGVYKGAKVHLAAKDNEIAEDEFGVGRHVFRGNVYGGGKGTDTITEGPNRGQYSASAGRVYGNTNVTVSDSALIYNRVYGGGSLASVGTFTYHTTLPSGISLSDSIQRITYVPGTGITHVTVKGGQIGTNGLNNGDVVGGGRGLVGNPNGSDTIVTTDLADQVVRLAYVGETHVTIDSAAHVKSNVYGGALNGHVYGDTYVELIGGTVGDTTQNASGNWIVQGGWHSNVYGGGGGTSRYVMANGDKHLSITAGRVYGNTHVTVHDTAWVLNNVYGGGPIASVGTYDLRSGQANPIVSNTASSQVTITGGTIGYDGNGNGNVFGSGLGVACTPGDYPDSLSYSGNTLVTIGTIGGSNDDLRVNGSVFGSGENGHVFFKSLVNVHSGTIGCTAGEYAMMSDSLKEHFFPLRGNVYGAGRGIDTLADGSYNPIAGIVQGDAEVNITGGYISHNVYGGGAMASVGYIDTTKTVKNESTVTSAAISWPYKFEYAMGGQAIVTVTGGHIGTVAAPLISGDVYGSSRGEAGNRYKYGKLANVREAHVIVDFTPNLVNPIHDSTAKVIVGSVYGSGENGHVYENTYDTIFNGLIGGSVFGGGKGSELYRDSLWLADGSGGHTTKYDTLVHSITAGKVYGNTHVIVNNGVIKHNVFGGGNMASVGKGNYYKYGEQMGNVLVHDTTDSGHCTVKINGGTIGQLAVSTEDWADNGHVFGSSKGITFTNITEKPHYNYSHDFFLGYANYTHVTIGDGTHQPTIYGSVFGGGEDGHVRFNSNVTVESGEIGLSYDTALYKPIQPITADQWKLRGNVYGAGRGIDLIEGSTDYCYSAGSVTDSTHVTIKGGLIHRHVYGGGSLATVGPPRGYTGNSISIVDIEGGIIGDSTSVAHEYGGDVYGSSRGDIAAVDAQQDTLATVYKTQVNIGKKVGSTLTGNGLVQGSVYGSGENGHVSTNATVNIYSGRIGDAKTQVENTYCGNVYGGGSGTDTLPDGTYNRYAGVVYGNTNVNLEGGWVMRNVYGGGEMASVGTIDSLHIHEASHPFNISWPYYMRFAPNTGKATVTVTGGRVGITGKDGYTKPTRKDNGDVYGGGKGTVGERYAVGRLANVDTAVITINYDAIAINAANPDNYSDTTAANRKGCITGAVYGGGENGHVNHDTYITLTKGLVGHAIYGGGKGKDTYGADDRYDVSAGKVYGNTHITINAANNSDAYVVRSVFGGGNLASVGVGNYAGGVGDYNSTVGYGELVASAAQWADTTGRGHTYINVTGGTLGCLNKENKPDKVFKDNIPYGSVFGGCRGMAVRDVLTTEIADLYGNRPDVFMGFINHTHVTIGTPGSDNGPKLYGSVYGGAQDGHVRWNANVTVNSGEIGVAPGSSEAGYVGGGTNYDMVYWTARGNVFGAGSGIGTWDTIVENPVTHKNDTLQRYSSLAGSVTQKTRVVINGGTVNRNVYGGGDLATVGPPLFGTTDCSSTLTGATIDINGAIGHSGSTYGGHVYGGSRGMANPDSVAVQQFKKFALVSYATIDINDGANVANVVYGGGENGQIGLDGATSMTHNTVVNINGGTVEHTVYGGGEGVFGNQYFTNDTISGFIMGNSEVNLLAGTVNNVFGGGRNAVIAGGATVNIGKADLSNTGTTFTGNVYGANNHNGTPLGDVLVNVYNTKHTAANTYPTLPSGASVWTPELLEGNADTMQYAINMVFGGGNQSNYTPGAVLYHRSGKSTPNSTTVHVYNCDNTIKEVYGGANAADIGTSAVHTDANVIIEGGRFHHVFGGGNGETQPANIYGTATTDIQGGLIDAVYGGGNHAGSILQTHLMVNDANSCDMLCDTIFGGSNEAPIIGDVTTTIACGDGNYDNIYGGANNADITGNVTLNILGNTITNVYGGSRGTGSKPADINGNVTLNIHGGTITNAFGGSDINGNITGVVTVNVLDTVSNCQLDLTHVYGGSNTATYTPDSITLAGGGKATPISPVVNLIHGTVKGNVYGGGLGVTATSTSNPEVNIGVLDATTLASLLPTGLTPFDSVKGNVYGGGSLADVVGNTTVNINRGVVGDITYAKTTGSAVYDTIIHAANSGMVFGGGQGRNTNIATDHNIARVTGDTRVNIKGGQVLYNVYGGGELSSVSDSAFVTVTGGQVGPAPKVEPGYNIPIGLNGINGYVFGGGKGIGDDAISTTNPYGAYYQYANVNNTLVTIDMPNPATHEDSVTNRLWGSTFGGAEDGHVLRNTNVRYVSGLMGTTGTTSYDGNIFGGGRNYSKMNYTAGRVGGDIKVEMSGGQLYGSIFGGGRLALTGINEKGEQAPGAGHGNVKVVVKGGKIGNEKLINTWTASTMGDVYGGGKGSMEGLVGHPAASALLVSLTRNTEVIIKDSINSGTLVSRPVIYGTVFGGGEMANVGYFDWDTIINPYTSKPDIANIDFIEGDGHTKVVVSGGRIGPDRMKMRSDLATDGSYNLKYNDDVGHVVGGGEGIIDDPVTYDTINPAVDISSGTHTPYGIIVTPGDFQQGGIHNYKSLLDLMATVYSTEVVIGDSAWVKGSVYGGSMNGHVMENTSVKIQGGQIGSAEMPTGVDERKFTEADFLMDSLPECPHWPYGDGSGHYYSHDPLDVQAGNLPSDGRSWFGSVFGGGSGYYPYISNTASGADTAIWNPESGKVYGKTNVEITKGHILTSVYGGCETTNVCDTAFVTMSGGTVGVPRKLNQIKRHPVTCYLYGAGKGDPRINFNTITNVKDVVVEVSGGTVFGSVYGGGEDGHVLDNVKVTIKGSAKIGTLGYSYYDGNVFGSGRGFAGYALTAGMVGGNITVNIEGGEMLGSVYGGGRLASVGTHLVPVSSTNYGMMQNGSEHGYVTVNISGGTIGNDYEAVYHTDFNKHLTGGNVFGGSMGRLTTLDGNVNSLWPDLAKVKRTFVNISDDAVIKGTVYGGGEFGTVEENAVITISGGEIHRDVYGGGYGSDSTNYSGTLHYITSTNTYAQTEVTPMWWAGRVKGNATVNISGGWIKKSVYGGGELATIGSYADTTKHTASHPFNVSWPYEFVYKAGTGTASINMTGGRIGITGKDYMGPWALGTGSQGQDTLIAVNAQGTPLSSSQIDDARQDNGDLYGGCKGKPMERYIEALMANVAETNITINISSEATPYNYKDNTDLACITGAVYGGGENGHVIKNTNITLNNGVIGHAVYGGGKGKGEYQGRLWDTNIHDYVDTTVYSYTAGKVYGNTYFTMNGGNVVRSIFGGGNQGSVGIGNYAGGVGDYNPVGYGEVVTNLQDWDTVRHSGHTYVNIYGGTVGMLNKKKPDKVFKDNIPYGSVFGGCRGLAIPDVNSAEEIEHLVEARPDALLSYTNYTHVTIGALGTPGPKLYGSVFGGAQDGHVRWDANAVVNSGEIGVDYGGAEWDSVANNSTDVNTKYWIARGNVFGGGSGIGTYDIITYNTTTHEYDTIHDNKSSIAGSITQSANVTINGGTIHRNVYGGGNRATIGAPRLTQPHDCPIDSTCVTVNINNKAIIGKNTNPGYGGYVYGGARGVASNTGEFINFGLCSYTVVNINDSVTVVNDVFGGGENGQIAVVGGDLVHTTEVNINDHATVRSVYGGGQGMWGETGYENDTVSGRVKGMATVNVSDNAHVQSNVFGGGKMGITYGETYVNISDDCTVDNSVYGGAFGKAGQVHVLGRRMVNMRGGYVINNIYGGSSYADEALKLFPEAATTSLSDSLTTVCVVNFSGGHAGRHVFGAGNFGHTLGSTYVFIGVNAIMNAPNHVAGTAPYNETFYSNTTHRRDLIIERDVWGGDDWGETGSFGPATITGRSDIYVDGYGYDTESVISQGNHRFMNFVETSLFGCGTLNDGGKHGKRIMVRNVGHANENPNTSGTDKEPYTDATRTFVSIQYADSLIVEKSHIHLLGRGKVDNNNATEPFAIYSIFDTVRMVNGSSLFIDKPIRNIGGLCSNYRSGDMYAAAPTYQEVNYDELTGIKDNKIRINNGTHVMVIRYLESGARYGTLRGYFHMMTDGNFNAFAYARPKHSTDAGNSAGGWNNPSGYSNDTDGGFVSYRGETYNTYDINGGTTGTLVQMPYQNHTPLQNRNLRIGEEYFRVWRYYQSGISKYDIVLHADSKPGTGFSFYPASLMLPPQSDRDSYYKIVSVNDIATINYGSEIKTVNAGMQEAANNADWMRFVNNSNPPVFEYDLASSDANLTTAQNFMTNHPNNAFGLTMIPSIGFASDAHPVLLCTEANDGLVQTRWDNSGEMSEMPEVQFVLTHANKITGNYAWDPLSVTLIQMNHDNIVTDTVEIHVYITTQTSIDDPSDVDTYAMMIHTQPESGEGEGDHNDVYTAKVMLPTYQLYSGHERSVWTLDTVKWIPNEPKFDQNTLVEGEPYPAHTPTKNFVGMTISPSVNFDNSNGWFNNESTFDTIDFGANKLVGGNNPITTPIYLGETKATDPISFNFDLHYDSKQNAGAEGNDTIGCVEVTAHFTNYKDADGQDYKFYVYVHRRGKGRRFYIDGVNGDFAYSGKYPDAAQPSLAGIYYFGDHFEPADTIFIVNKVTANAVGNLNWGDDVDRHQLKIYRYNGGDPLAPSGDPRFEDYSTAYYNEHGTNPAYKGTLIDVETSMKIASTLLDGSHLMKERYGNAALVSPETYLEAGEPMINILNKGVLTVVGGTESYTDLRNNYNAGSHGGAIRIEKGGTLKMNRNAHISDNYVKGDDYHGGGVYVGDSTIMLVSDDVMINTNKHVSTAKTEESENVYLADYSRSLIDVGTLVDNDDYGPLSPDSRIGVTKTCWDGHDYMPVIYTEDITHYSNLLDNTIVFNDEARYSLYEYPERFPNGDVNYLNKLYWVKTWVDVVTSKPEGFTPGSTIDISTPEQLAWAISYVNGLNNQRSHPTQNFNITNDIDMSQYIWVPIGYLAISEDTATYRGTFEGNGHAVTGIRSQLSVQDKGMFGYTKGATIKNLLVQSDFYNGKADYLGGIIGIMQGGNLINCESSGYLETTNDSEGFIGGLVGKTYSGSLIHSCFATDTLCGLAPDMIMGGLIAEHTGGNLLNSYSRVVTSDDNVTENIGGLVGINESWVENCYTEINITNASAFAVYNTTENSVIKFCYANSNDDIEYVGNSGVSSTLVGHGKYGTVKDRKAIGYMYFDTKVTAAATATATDTAYIRSKVNYVDKQIVTWPALVSSLNQWVNEKNAITDNSSPYYNKEFVSWFRPTTANINADLPVLAFPKDVAMATDDSDGRFLRYSNSLDGLLNDYSGKSASIFLYGNATEVTRVPTANEKVFVNENAVLTQASSTKDEFINTTVGITFDNSSKHAKDSENNTLEYDWHLLSTPLSNAPMGTTYERKDASGDYQPHDTQHYDWVRYQTDTVDIASMHDSYFPNGLPMGSGYENVTSDPDSLKWDFYNYFEPEYHWINLKRNKKNHFHRDAHEYVLTNEIPYQLDAVYDDFYRHYQIQYTGTDQADNDADDATRVFTPGKGYMMAISQESYLSSTGSLNREVTIPITAEAPDDIAGYPSHNRGTNLVGNPYQAYLDLDTVSTKTVNVGLDKFWVYDADEGVYAPYTKSASKNPRLPSQYLHPHQGFFVLTDANRNMIFTPDMAGADKDEGSYFRKVRPNYPLVNLLVYDELGNRDLAIVELERPQKGGVQKAENLQNANFKLYARFENESYGLLFTPKDTERIPVFFKTPDNGTYTLRWDKHNGTFNAMYLIDNITGERYDMLAHDHYTFQAFATDYAARFYIVFDVEPEPDEPGTEEPQVLAYFNGTGWVINGQGVLQLVDMVGHVLYADYLSGESTVVNFGDVAAGVYLLKMGDKTQKIVIL